jgi:hypothetical protein
MIVEDPKITNLKESYKRLSHLQTLWVYKINKSISQFIYDVDVEVTRSTEIKVSESSDESTWRSVTDSIFEEFGEIQ